MRRTLAGEITATGIALHTGVPARLRLGPAEAGRGIVFRRSDRDGAEIPALWSNVVQTELGTVIANADGIRAGVIEHIMAALAGAEIDDCIIDIDGPEPPILDGDALSYLELIEQAGIVERAAPRRVLRLRRTVSVGMKTDGVALLPAARSEYFAAIDFSSAAIGRQEFVFLFSREAFRREIAPARTFGFLRDAEKLRAAGFARGADLGNTLVLDGDKVVNAPLQRFPDEFVRHKILDVIGDMKLAGYPLLARFEGHRSSHRWNNALLRALFADATNYEIVAV